MIDKILLLYVCISIACAFWQPGIIFNNPQGDDTLQTFFNLGYNSTTNQPSLPTCAGNNCWGSDFNQLETPNGNQTFLDRIFNKISTITNFFVDALNNVISFIQIIFRIAFAPWIIFTSEDMRILPPAFFWAIAVPLALLFLVAFINWIRSGIT